MLDVRPTAYIVPLAEQVLDDITPVIQVTSAGDEDARVTGLVRIYRESTGLLIFTSKLAITIVPHGTVVNIAALSAWSPPAPADDDFFILVGTTAVSLLHEEDILSAPLGAFHFDIKPGPMGPAPAAHGATHEDGGMDEISIDALSGVPAARGQAGGLASLDGATLVPTAELGTGAPTGTKFLRDDGTWQVPPGAGVTDHGALTGLADDDHPQYRLRHQIFWETECLMSSAGPTPWYMLAIATGTLANTTPSASHLGIYRITSSTSANSGFYIRTHALSLLLAGSEQSLHWHRPQTLSGTTRRTGYHDATNVTAPVDGAYIYQDPSTGKITGRTMAASAGSTTGTDYQLVTNTWYCEKIVVNADATRVDFYLYDDAGALLWTDFLTTNIPTAYLGHATVVTNSGTTAVDLDDVDYMSMRIPDRRPNL